MLVLQAIVAVDEDLFEGESGAFALGHQDSPGLVAQVAGSPRVHEDPVLDHPRDATAAPAGQGGRIDTKNPDQGVNFALVSSENVDEKHPPSLQGRTSIEPLPSGRCPAEGRCEATRRPPPLRPPLFFGAPAELVLLRPAGSALGPRRTLRSPR